LIIQDSNILILKWLMLIIIQALIITGLLPTTGWILDLISGRKKRDIHGLFMLESIIYTTGKIHITISIIPRTGKHIYTVIHFFLLYLQ